MDNEADIGLVYAHPESDGCHDDPNIIAPEELLVFCTFLFR
ncbi:MAG: hypothetical protein A4E72_01579 [Syntrophus sp. PtaU1.Bin208]|nr:MAG: hypothetical protein A4E72_01579 [Syntrophus sp. PtaU1.Bin208]